MTFTAHKPTWSRNDIRLARRAQLPPLLVREGFRLRETGAGNFELLDHPGLIVKEAYWRWPDQNKQGNAIDLFVQVLGRSFHEAMTTILKG
jgi:hypothetical protein